MSVQAHTRGKTSIEEHRQIAQAIKNKDAQLAEIIILRIQINIRSQKLVLNHLPENSIIQGIHNTDQSIKSFARCCFTYAVDTKQSVWFGTKDTISKKYDHTFKDIFQEIFDQEYKTKFDAGPCKNRRHRIRGSILSL